MNRQLKTHGIPRLKDHGVSSPTTTCRPTQSAYGIMHAEVDHGTALMHHWAAFLQIFVTMGQEHLMYKTLS